MIRSTLIVLVVLPAVASSGSTTQTDWSGGFGHIGPFPTWGSVFLECHADWGQSIPGQVTLPLILDSLYWKSPSDRVSEPAAFERILSLDAVDIDADGSIDLIASTQGPGYVIWFDNPLTEYPWWSYAPFDSTVACDEVIAFDVSGDGFPEILGRSGTAVYLWRRTPQGDWSRTTVAAGLVGVTDIDAGDIDADGDADIAILQTGYPEPNPCTWLKNIDGSGTVWERVDVPDPGFYGHTMRLADVDLDGDQDVFTVWPYYYFTLKWYENLNGEGTSWAMHNISGPYSYSPVALIAGDFDSDGDIDPMSSFSVTVETELYLNDYLSWSGILVSDDLYSRILEMVDIESDGDWDAIGVDHASGWPSIRLLINSDGEGQIWQDQQFVGCFLDSLPFTTADLLPGPSMDIAIWDEGLADVIVLPFCQDEYQSSGWLCSSILYCGFDPDWQYLDWSAQIPAGTSIAFSLRAADDPMAMGEWSDSFTTPPASLEGVLTDGASYLQYKVQFTTENSLATPVLEDVTVTWNDLSVEGGGEPQSADYLSVHANPAAGSASLSYGIGETGHVSLTVHDLTGRAIRILLDGVMQEGEYSTTVDDLPAGVYMVRLSTQDWASTTKLVFLR